MQQSKQEVHGYQEDEIDLRALFNSLVAGRFLIAGLTGFGTVIAILYVLMQSPTPIYEATSSFISPSTMSVITINRLNLTTETKESIFSEFLTQLSSKSLQKQAFIEGDFITRFNTHNNPIDDVDAFISGATGSVKVHSPDLTMDEKGLVSLSELPYSVSIEGNSAEVISKYLNALVDLANSKTIMGLINLNELKIDNRIEEISIERALLLEQGEQVRFSKIERIKEEDGQKIRQINDQIEALKIKAKRDRLNKIERIKEEDGQKIRQINDQIDRARFKAKENRLNEIILLTEQIDSLKSSATENRLNDIVVLTDFAKLAKSLGIIENNFKLINNGGAKSDLTIAIGESKDLPEWYLYGEKALLEKIELLKTRKSDNPFIPELVTLLNQIELLETLKSDDPFIPELVTLNNQLNEVQNNNLLKTLLARQDDGPFIPELVTLNNQLNEIQNNNLLKTLLARQDDGPFIADLIELGIEKIKLESIIVKMPGVNAMQLRQISIPLNQPLNKPNRKLILLLAFIGSFMISIFLVLIMYALKPDEKALA